METVETLGKYEIKRQLGRGAMGVVYEGWDPSIQRRVAVKTVPLTDVDDPETQEQIARFRREAQAAGRLTHENIVPVYDYGETAGVAYIVMEYVEGPTLDSLMKKQERFGMTEILRIMKDLLAGLEFSHERGVVHRDIKPANLMLTSNDMAKSRIKIADFGIARIESSSMTQAGTMIGTPTYMSPEQFMAETVDSRTDIYSSGVLLYQLLTGERPFEGGLSAIMHKALHTEPLAPSQLSVTSPPALDAVVKKAMAKRPNDRFATATAFSEALIAAASVSAAVVTPPPEDATIIETRRPAASAVAQPVSVAVAAPAKRGMMPVLAGAAVVLLVGAGGAFYLLRPSADVPRPTPSPAVTTPPPAPVPAPLQPAEVAPAPVAPAPVAPVPVAPRNEAVTPAAKPAVSPAMISDMFAQITATQRCAFIGGSVRDNGEAVLTGIAGPNAQADIRQSIASHAVPGTMQWKVAGADTVFCPALTLLQSIAPPFGSADPALMLTLADNRTALHDGDHIRPRLTMPGFVGYLRVDYIAHDGTVQHLYPQVADSSGAVADKVHEFVPDQKVSLGDPAAGQPGWEVAPPFGTDMIIAVASSRPLFTRPRAGNVETAVTYLRDLDAAVRAVRDGGGKLVGNALLVDALAK
jgi:serine/threonine-protein kinase